MRKEQNFVFNYNRFKFTNGIFFKSIQLARAEVYTNRFVVEVYPYFGYSGTYYIAHSVPQDKGILNAVIKHEDGKEPIFDPLNPMYIYISDHGDILKIYDGNLVGIIFKF